MTYIIKDPIFSRIYKILIFKNEDSISEFEIKNNIDFGVRDKYLNGICGNFFEDQNFSVITIPSFILKDLNPKTLSKLAKECMYCMFDTFDLMDIKLDLDNQEIPAYYFEWLYNESLNIVYKYQKLTQKDDL